MNVPLKTSYFFAVKARNSFGVSNFTQEILIIAENSPYAVKQVEIKYNGTDVSISWNNSFVNNGYTFLSFDLVFYYN